MKHKGYRKEYMESRVGPSWIDEIKSHGSLLQVSDVKCAKSILTYFLSAGIGSENPILFVRVKYRFEEKCGLNLWKENIFSIEYKKDKCFQGIFKRLNCK